MSNQERGLTEYNKILHASRSKEHHDALELKAREMRIQRIAEQLLYSGNVSAKGCIERAEEFELLCEQRLAERQAALSAAANALSVVMPPAEEHSQGQDAPKVVLS